jgi:hypothetical protein
MEATTIERPGRTTPVSIEPGDFAGLRSRRIAYAMPTIEPLGMLKVGLLQSLTNTAPGTGGPGAEPEPESDERGEDNGE